MPKKPRRRKKVKFYADYSDYLNSNEWQQLRADSLKKHGKRCQICLETRGLHQHHLRYGKRWDDTTVDDLMPLCDACHKTVHRHEQMPMDRAVLIAKYRKMFMRQPSRRPGISARAVIVSTYPK